MKKLKTIGLLLLLLLSTLSIPVLAEPDIGYVINGDVVEIWNPDTTYYFNKTSGIQWTEDPDQYWTRNVFGFGYYDAQGDFNEIYSADDLGTFNRDIESDYSTYVNATLYKDFTYNGYELRLGIRYHLKVEDTDLSVIIYVKNRGSETIPYDLGFSWTVTDIDIPNPLGEDRIFINQTYYELDGVYDLTFTDMGFNETWIPAPYYRISDYTQFLTLEWDYTVPYSVHLYGNGIQEQAKVTWLVNAGIFKAGQEKSTILFWADAEGDFIDSFALAPHESDLQSITTDNTHIWFTDTNNDAFVRFLRDGTYVDNFTTLAQTTWPYGCGTNGTHLYTTDVFTDLVYVYFLNGTFLRSWSTAGHGNSHQDITSNGTFIWTLEVGAKDVHRWQMDGTWIDSFSVAVETNAPRGLTTDSNFIWVVDQTDEEVYKYTMAGVFVSQWNTDGQTTSPRGITTNGTNIWIGDSTTARIYRYEMNDPNPAVADAVADATFALNFPSWVNVTVSNDNGVVALHSVDIYVNTTGNSENFTLRWNQTGDAFSEVSDPDGIITLNASSVRTNINATFDLISFNFLMSGGQDGPCDVLVTVVNDGGFSANQTFPALFSFSFFNWSPVGDALNSAFGFWGITNFMDEAADYITGLSVYFVSSMVNLVALVVQQMRMILAFFGAYLKVFTNMVDAMLTLWDLFYSFINGTNPIIDLGIGNFWDFIAFGTWQMAFYFFVVLFWLNGLPNRAKLTGRGELGIIVSDINQVINITSYFLSTFAFLLNEVANWALKLFDAITGVIPV